jgi:hypothetical protein
VLFEQGKTCPGVVEHWFWHACQAGNLEPITPIGRSGLDLVQESHLAGMLNRL